MTKQGRIKTSFDDSFFAGDCRVQVYVMDQLGDEGIFFPDLDSYEHFCLKR